MGKSIFNFDERRSKELQINGVDFVIDVEDQSVMNTLLDSIKKFEEFAKDIESRGPSEISSDFMIETVAETRDEIDKILGDGASDKIFKSRDVNVNELHTLVAFLMDELGKELSENNKRKYDPQRLNK